MSTEMIIQKNTSVGLTKTIADDTTPSTPEDAEQTTFKNIGKTRTSTGSLEADTSQTVVVMVKNEKNTFPKWEIIGAAVGVSLMVFLIIILLMMRNRKRNVKSNIPYMRESVGIQNQVLEKRDKNVRELTENPLYQPAYDFEKSQSSKTVTSEGKKTQNQVKDMPLDEVEYGLRENPLYQSADDEINETEKYTTIESHANYSFYSEIDGNSEKTRANIVTYDYADTYSLAKSTDD
ncbi:uncharacterized protein LOC134230352 [Saccostrea cucullata]|uniref:uncharacterized protein LOC134230352 n=1 Tax=Saccostrea cuccullata TaxID=36930 RepID=UPI002ED11833